MESKDVTRRKFFQDVAKYCGAGVAALGILSLKKSAHAVDDLDMPAHSGVWQMRDVQLDQYGEFIKNAPLPEGYFSKEEGEFVNNMKPVDWNHLHQNWYDEGGKSSVSIVQATPLDKDLKGDIKRAVDKMGGLGKALNKNDKILIKPNMNTGDPWPGGGTDHRFLDALIQVLQDAGYGNLTVGDSCGPWGPTERVIKMLGHDTVCKKQGVNLLDFDKGKWMHINNPKAEFLGRFGGGDGTVGYVEALRHFDKIIYTPSSSPSESFIVRTGADNSTPLTTFSRAIRPLRSTSRSSRISSSWTAGARLSAAGHPTGRRSLPALSSPLETRWQTMWWALGYCRNGIRRFRTRSRWTPGRSIRSHRLLRLAPVTPKAMPMSRYSSKFLSYSAPPISPLIYDYEGGGANFVLMK